MQPNNKRIRWSKWDYRSKGAYFITINTSARIRFFGSIKKSLHPSSYSLSLLNSYLKKSTIAQTVFDYWHEIPDHYPYVELDTFVIMPDHIHGILIFDKPPLDRWEPTSFGPQKNNLPDIIRAFKGSVKRWANKNQIQFKWQSRYHDRVIRDHEEMERIRKYIQLNPYKWSQQDTS